MDLSPQQLHALAVASKDAKAVRSKLVAGSTTKIDCLIRLQGKLVVGHPSTYVTPKLPDARQLLELILAEFGPRKRVQIVSKVIDTVKSGGLDAEKSVTEEVDRLIRDTTIKQTVGKNGAVTGLITASIVEPK